MKVKGTENNSVIRLHLNVTNDADNLTRSDILLRTIIK